MIAARGDGAPGLLFVTGMQRSGTTLTDRLLDAHPGIALASQPWPLLHVAVKRMFIASGGFGDPAYPLGHLFGAPAGTVASFTRFLDDVSIDAELIANVSRDMASYSGRYSRAPLPTDGREASILLPHAARRGFAPALRALLAPDSPGLRWVGSKETTCEEFIPHLLAAGARVVLVIRDPRDVLASLNHGDGGAWTGAPKPTLFNLRQWRKSVAFAIACRSHPGCRVIRYEDLVLRTDETLGELAAWLGVERWAGAGSDEPAWRSPDNSSFGSMQGIAAGSIARHREILAEGTIRFIEAACLPELRWLGYATDLDPRDAPEALRAEHDPYVSPRAALAMDATDPPNLARERERLERLTKGDAGDEWSIFPDVAIALRGALQ